MTAVIPARGTILRGTTDRYIIDASVSQGGVGAVLRAQRASDRQETAVKVLHGGRFPITDAARERFQTEIRITQHLSHPNLVSYIDHGVWQEYDFLVMEYLTGGTVANRIERNDYSPLLARRWCYQLLHAVDFLYRSGLVHRDIKPNNILLTSDEQAKVADLGLALGQSRDDYLTLSGDQMGSLLYISPHQRRQPHLANAADDVYSCCCCLYEILSRQRIHVMPQDLIEIVGDDVPAYVCDLIMGCLGGADGEITLRHLLGCFEITPTGYGAFSPAAQDPAINEWIQLLPSLQSRNRGLQRHRVASDIGFRALCERYIPDHYHGGKPGGLGLSGPQIGFLSEDLLVVAGQEAEDAALELLRLDENALHSVGTTATSRSSRMAILDTSVFLLSDEDARLFRFADSRLRHIKTWDAKKLGGRPYSGDISTRRDCPLVAIASDGLPGALICDVSSSSFMTIEYRRKRSFVLPKIGLLGPGRMVVWDGEDLVVVRFDLESSEHEEERRLAFPREVFALAGSKDGHSVYVGYDGGLRAMSIDSGETRTLLPPSSSMVGNVVCHPSLGYLLVGLGFGLGPCRFIIVNEEATASFHLPDGGESDSLRFATHAAWSPLGNRLAVTDKGGYLSIFQTAELAL